MVLLAGSFDLRPSTAQSGDDVPLAVKPGHGFDWFFANVKKPDTPCAGQHVVATWYDTGTQTASGQPFNPNHMTAAHRTLPFGSKLLITNPHNGKSVVIVINDRGPFTKGVTLDLARGAARAIGMRDTQWVCMTESNL